MYDVCRGRSHQREPKHRQFVGELKEAMRHRRLWSGFHEQVTVMPSAPVNGV